MRRLFALTALLLAALPALAGAQPFAPAASIPQQSAGFATPGAIATDGAYVVWSELIQPTRFSRHANLYAAEVWTGQVFTLGERLEQSSYWTHLSPGFALDGGVVVWIDRPAYEGIGRGLVATDLRTGQTSLLSAADVAYPALGDGWVSWWEWYPAQAPGAAGQARLMLLAFGDDAGPAVLTTLALPDLLSLRGGPINSMWAVYLLGEQRNGPDTAPCWNLWAVPRGVNRPQLKADLGCSTLGYEPRPALRGNSLAVSDADGRLRVVNLSDGVAQTSGPHGNLGQAWGGNDMLFWVNDAREVWGYDPRNDSAFPIARDASNYVLDAGGGLVVYTTNQLERFTLLSKPYMPLVPSARRDPSDPSLQGRGYFAETAHSLGGEFAAYWQRNGGLPVFGYPLTEEFVQRAPGEGAGYTVQYFERQRFEFHPENPAPYNVLLGRLGAEALAAEGRDWQRFPRADPRTPGYYPLTGQAIAPEFLAYWRGHGLDLGDPGVSEREALALWGLPLSPAQIEQVEGRAVLVQWFERARFEYHPENPEPYRVLLGRLAAERVVAFAWP